MARAYAVPERTQQPVPSLRAPAPHITSREGPCIRPTMGKRQVASPRPSPGNLLTEHPCRCRAFPSGKSSESNHGTASTRRRALDGRDEQRRDGLRCLDEATRSPSREPRPSGWPFPTITSHESKPRSRGKRTLGDRRSLPGLKAAPEAARPSEGRNYSWASTGGGGIGQRERPR